jgi:hypothetical protein
MTADTNRTLEQAIKSIDRLGPQLRSCCTVKTFRNTPALVVRLASLALLIAALILATSIASPTFRLVLAIGALALPVLGGLDGRRAVEANDAGVCWRNLRKRSLSWNDIGRVDYRRGRVELRQIVGAPIALRPLTSYLPGPGRRMAAQHAAILSEELARSRARSLFAVAG